MVLRAQSGTLGSSLGAGAASPPGLGTAAAGSGAGWSAAPAPAGVRRGRLGFPAGAHRAPGCRAACTGASRNLSKSSCCTSCRAPEGGWFCWGGGGLLQSEPEQPGSQAHIGELAARSRWLGRRLLLRLVGLVAAANGQVGRVQDGCQPRG